LRKKQFLLVMILGSLVLGIIIPSLVSNVQAAEGTLNSVYTSTAPTLDGEADEEIWASASEAVITVTGGTIPGDVTLKSVYTDTHIYIYAEWEDSTMSITRGSGAWVWSSTDGWSHPASGGSEDRLAILWNVNITGFDTSGGYTKCHTDGAYLNNEGEIGDVWHMKSARSLPVLSISQSGTISIDSDYQATAGKFEFSGYVDDKYVSYDEEPHEGDAGRHGDSGSSTYGRNRNADKTAPLYIEINPDDYVDAMVLTQSEIDNGETYEIETASASEIASAVQNYETLNALVPERILRAPTGSRGDVTQAAIWEDGVWYTEIARELETGNEDDVQFNDLSDSYSFGVALMDNSGGGDDHSTHPSSYVLTFAPDVIPGYELLILFGVTSITTMIILYSIKKKRRLQ
jgi:hypothetical protein